MESRAPAAAHNAEPSPPDGRGRPHSAPGTPRWPRPQTPRPAGRSPPAGTSGAYPAPAAAAIKSGCFAWNFFVPQTWRRGSLARLPTQACAATPPPQAARRAPRTSSRREGPKEWGWGEEAQARGQRSHARNAHPFPF